MRTQTMSGKDYLRLLNVECGKHCAWQSVVGGWMVVFKGSTRTITIKINRIHLAIVKRGDNIAHPALFVITETRKGLFDILVQCCERLCREQCPGGLLLVVDDCQYLFVNVQIKVGHYRFNFVVIRDARCSDLSGGVKGQADGGGIGRVHFILGVV